MRGNDEADLRAARQELRKAERVVVFTGAGVSAESGVPTFRGKDGLWKRHRPESLATPQAFRRDPRLVWEWYGWRRDLIVGCEPNPAHLAIAQAQLESDARIHVVTQNVDGLHELALRSVLGQGREPPERLRPLEIHGSIYRSRCTACGREIADRSVIDASRLESLPTCLECHGLMRPAVVWYGEALDSTLLDTAFTLAAEADICLVVGTSALVHPAAAIPRATIAGGGSLIEVNPNPTPLSPSAALSLLGQAGSVLPRILP